MSAIKTADKAARTAFDAYLVANRSTATQYVPAEVVAAAKAAYKAAGGTREIVVVGSGNRTHPVCTVSVRAKRKGD